MRYKINIKVHPAVRRYIDNNFPLKSGAYDVTKSIYYYLVSSVLYQSNVKVPSKVCVKFNEYVPISILVTEYDFYHYGFTCSDLQMCRLSRNILHLIIDDACRRVAMAKVMFGIPVTKGIDHFLIDNFFEEDELKAELIRTIYKRKYKKYETDMKEYLDNMITDYGYSDEPLYEKNYGQIGPKKINTKILWKI